MKKSIIAICGVALAAVAFAQGPVCDGKRCPRPPCHCGPQDRERPVVLFVCDKVDDAAVEAYKQAVLAKIDEAVAKSREQKVPAKLVFIADGKPHGMRGPKPGCRGPKPECRGPKCGECPPPEGPAPEEAPAPEAPAPEAE